MTVPAAQAPRLLYITNGFPYPLTSGYLRHYFLTGELTAAGYRIVLLSVVGADHRPEHVDAMADRTERVETFRSLDRAAGAIPRFTRRVRRVLPGGGEPAAQRMAERIEAIRSDEQIDAVIFSGRRTDAALAALDGLPVVVDMCDATSLRLEREMEVARPSRRAVLEMHVRRVRQIERLMMARADRLFFASARDLEALMPGATPDRLDHAAVIPNGVDTDFWSRSSPTLGTDEIVLTGAMSYGPNVDASVRLAEAILPLVRREVSDARLTIVGRDPAAAVTALAGIDGVTVTGYVDDVRPYLDRAAVFAAPLRFGAGIQNKLLEAMAMSVPSVVSDLAADGLRTVGGDVPPVVIADGDAETAAAIVTELRRVATDPRPDEAARAYVQTNFSWERSGETLAGLVSGARADRPARAPAGSPAV
jgi:hypothetical protein